MTKNKKTAVFLDNEGPLTLNDNAYETTVALAKKCGLGKEIGDAFYKRMSNIDDIWGDFHRILKDPTYSSGHTLKVILPFFKAMEANYNWLYEFARNNVRAMPFVKDTLQNLNQKYEVWQISTSYEFFIKAFCSLIEFDFERTRCTYVKEFDEIPINRNESNIILDFMKEVADMPIVEYNEKTGGVIPKHQKYYNRFTSFVWKDIYSMPAGKLLRSVHPIGQAQKRDNVAEICKQYNISLENAVYVGDSQTDVQCIQLLNNKGLTMMFNGKGKVCDNSDIMYIGEDARAIEEIVDLFTAEGRQAVLNYYNPACKAKFGGLLATVTFYNIDKLKDLSVKKRKKIRGVNIGELT